MKMIDVGAKPRTEHRTGVEMEALAAVTAALLTIYDMLKRYERGMRIEAVELVSKSGGRSGEWRRSSSRTGPSTRRPRAAKSRRA